MNGLSVSDISLSFGGLRALQEVSFDVPPGTIYSIVGPNGAGKTTLFNVITGVYPPSAGSVRLKGQTITGIAPHVLAQKGMTRTFQNLQIFTRMTALQNVEVGLLGKHRPNLVLDLLGYTPRAEAERLQGRAMDLLGRVGLSKRAHEVSGNLAYGDLKRLEIARALASSPTFLLLDEPAAGCSATETARIADLIRCLPEQGITIVLVEHDMSLVMSISDRILVLDRGQKLAEGTPSEIRGNQQVIEAYLGKHGSNASAGHA